VNCIYGKKIQVSGLLLRRYFACIKRAGPLLQKRKIAPFSAETIDHHKVKEKCFLNNITLHKNKLHVKK
jgi:hypothetical protein